MDRTDARNCSSKVSPVRTTPEDGWIAAKLSARPRDRMERALSMTPTANKPTAIDNTIKSVRVLLPARSLRTLYQRILIIGYASRGMDDLTIRQGNYARAPAGCITIMGDQNNGSTLVC